ncbi:TrbG/VirB9 family P-type conjugative transfer protein [Acinetobacter pittii]|uniref:TrbG/VirB9 family P-type conjugative transfer protein n=1 Tax=Acinetobacter pittii TaxID=48296 RepID=UPI00325FE64F
MKKTIISATLCVASALAINLAHAEVSPRGAGGDTRIMTVSYDPNEVVLIKAKAGIATNIVLNPDETYQTHAFGDSAAWFFSNFGNNIFIKPKVVDGSTNLTVVTDRRTYNFYIQYTKKYETFQVKFTYPEQVALKADKKALENKLNNRFDGKVINLAYYMKGSYAVKPINTWDDGSFTYFKFGNNTDLPAIYAVDDKGNESLYNRTVLGANNNVIMLHGISKKWRLRIGNSALDVQNMAFNEAGNDMSSGTINNSVERVVVDQE